MELDKIITIIISVVTLVAGGAWIAAKGKLAQARNLVREAWELINVLFQALEDNKITAAELSALKKEAGELKQAFRDLLGR